MRIHRGQLNQSEQMARALQRKNEKDSGAIMNLGLVWYKQKKYELARMAFNIARRSNRKEAAPNYYLGHVYMKLKNPTSAISSFQEAIKLRPNYPEALNALGVMYLKTSKVGLASAAFKRATEIMPKYWEAHINLGIALRQEQKINDALDRFLLVKKKNPYSNDAHYYLGILYLDHNLTKGRLQTARFLSSVPSSLQGDKAVFRQGNKIARYATASQYLQTYISRAAGLPADAPARKYLADAMKKKARAERGLKGMVKRKLKYRLRKLRRMRRRPPPAARKPAGAKAPANTGTAPANRKMIIVPVRRPAPR
jgi:tetratricopeptide (TPR) repeat protein